MAEALEPAEAIAIEWMLTDDSALAIGERHGVDHLMVRRILHERGLHPCVCPCRFPKQPDDDSVRTLLQDIGPVTTGRLRGAERRKYARRIWRAKRFRVSSAQLAERAGRSGRWVQHLDEYGRALAVLDDLRSGRVHAWLENSYEPELCDVVARAAASIQAWFDEHAPTERPENFNARRSLVRQLSDQGKQQEG